MIDIHEPHEAVHTWKDFFIHIATICVGLLIAIGLEQTVEAIHHAHERRALVSEMRLEAQRNIGILRTDIDRDMDKARWNLAVIAALQTTLPQDGVVTAVLPPHEDFLPQIYPSRAVWAVAKTNGKVALLSERQAEVYDRLESEAQDEAAAQDRYNIAATKLQGEEIRIGIRLEPGSTVKLPASEVPALTREIAETVASTYNDAQQDAFWVAASRAVAASVQDREDFLPYLGQERLALTQRLAKQ
jgi:hypothetical protein